MEDNIHTGHTLAHITYIIMSVCILVFTVALPGFSSTAKYTVHIIVTVWNRNLIIWKEKSDRLERWSDPNWIEIYRSENSDEICRLRVEPLGPNDWKNKWR